MPEWWHAANSAEDPKFWHVLWIRPLSAVSARFTWTNIHFWIQRREGECNNYAEKLGSTVQTFVAQATRCPWFVHPCPTTLHFRGDSFNPLFNLQARRPPLLDCLLRIRSYPSFLQIAPQTPKVEEAPCRDIKGPTKQCLTACPKDHSYSWGRKGGHCRRYWKVIPSCTDEMTRAAYYCCFKLCCVPGNYFLFQRFSVQIKFSDITELSSAWISDAIDSNKEFNRPTL